MIALIELLKTEVTVRQLELMRDSWHRWQRGTFRPSITRKRQPVPSSICQFKSVIVDLPPIYDSTILQEV
jgi:hypothetical protein